MDMYLGFPLFVALDHMLCHKQMNIIWTSIQTFLQISIDLLNLNYILFIDQLGRSLNSFLSSQLRPLQTCSGRMNNQEYNLFCYEYINSNKKQGKKYSVGRESKGRNVSLMPVVLEGHPKEKMQQNILRVKRNFFYWQRKTEGAQIVKKLQFKG